MYELNRIRLHNIGPGGARYGDVILDLSGGGAPVPQTALIANPLDVLRRPSPATLLVLINGGGKSVLIRLISSTILPRHQSERGRAALKDFLVSPGAPSHIALEWADARTGRRLVTGQVLSPVAGTTPDRLFYSFRPGPLLGIETLPISDGSRRLRLEEVRDALAAAHAAHKGLEVETETGQDAWEQHLRGLGLEPDLFAVQDSMNHSEGGAADVFRQTSGRHFVQWLLRQCLDADRYTDFASSFESYAANIRQHDQMRLEHMFCQQLEGTCTSLAGFHRDLVTAQQAQSRAQTRLGSLAASVRAARDLAGTERDDLARQAGDADESVIRLRGEVSAADLREKEVVRRTRLLKRDRAEAEATRLSNALSTARLVGDAWDRVPDLARDEAARERYRQLEILLSEAEKAARPARLARDTAGAAYRQALAAAENTALAEARKLDGLREKSGREAQEYDRQASEKERAAGNAEGTISQLRDSIADTEADIARARERGLLGPQETAADAASRLDREAKDAERRAGDLETAKKTAETEADTLRTAAENLEEPAERARSAAAAAASHAEQQRTAATAILNDPLTAELLELDPGAADADALTLLDQHADNLLTRAAEARDAAWRRQTEADDRVQNATRILEALSAADGGLLPPRPETEDIIRLLADHGVNAHTGWRWLEQTVNPSQHAEVIRLLPHLADGAVVATEQDLNRARDILAAQRPLPRAAVAVGLGDLLHDTADTEPEGFLVVDPTPALHDLVSAEAERERTESELAAAREEHDEQRQRHSAMSRLHDRTRLWREDNPAGSTVPLLDKLQSLQQADAKAAESLRQARETARSSAEEARRAASAAQQAAASATALRTDRDTADALARTEAKAAEYRERIADLGSQAESDAEEAHTLRERAEKIRKDNERRAIDAEGYRQDAARHSRSRAQVVAGTAAEADSALRDLPLSELAIRYQEASTNLRAAEADEDLRKQADEAEQAMKSATEVLADIAPDTLQRARQLLSDDPATADPEARDAAARRARQDASSLEGQLGDARTELGVATSMLAQASPPDGDAWTDLEDPWVPATAEDGDALGRRAAEETRAGQRRLAAAEADASSLRRRAEAAGTRYDQFDRVLLILGSPDPDPAQPTPEPYPGTVDEAQAEAYAVKRAADDAGRQASIARDHCRETALGIRTITSSPEFDSLTAPVKTMVAKLDPGDLPPRAAEWAQQMQSRIASLASDLEGADQNRRVLAAQLRDFAAEAFRILRKAERLSVLPASAGPWKDKQVLRIRFDMPDPTALTARAGDVIDQTARDQKQKRIIGIDLVLRCVTEAVTRDFAVSVLKPDQRGPVGHVPVERMREVFSEGQELTGAIMLYCTVAAIRIDARGHGQGRHGGMLILDNPIGKASAEYLLTLQMSLAEATGVQLIYTTGLEDDRVHATFPLRIRLRNSTDRRTGDQYLRVTGRAIGGPAEDEAGSGEETREISAIRLMDRPGA